MKVFSHVTAAPFHVTTVLFQCHTTVTFQYHSNPVPMSQQPHSSTTAVLFPCHSSPIPEQCSLFFCFPHVITAMLFLWEEASSRVFAFVLRVPGFLDSDEAPLLERLIEAYREKDSDALEQCCNSAVFRSMDTEVQALPQPLTQDLSACSKSGCKKSTPIWWPFIYLSCLKKVGLVGITCCAVVHIHIF